MLATGPSSYEKRIYRAAVSQRLRSTALDTHLAYVVFIAFSRQQRYDESNSLLRYSTLPVLLTFARFMCELCVQWWVLALHSDTNGNEILPKLNSIPI